MIRPPTKMEEKIAAKIKRVIQIGLSTHSHDHEINPVTFSTAKIKTKATIGSVLDRWDLFSVRITEPPWIPICWVEYTIPSVERTPLYARTFPFYCVRAYRLCTHVRSDWPETHNIGGCKIGGCKAKVREPPPWWYPAFARLPLCVLSP